MLYYNRRVEDINYSSLSFFRWGFGENLRLQGVHFKGTALFRLSNTLSLRTGGDVSLSKYRFHHHQEYTVSDEPLSDTLIKVSGSSGYGALFTEFQIIPYPLPDEFYDIAIKKNYILIAKGQHGLLVVKRE